MTAQLQLNGVDICATLGFQWQDQTTILDAVMGTQAETVIPNMPGAIIGGPFTTAVREFTLAGYLDAADQPTVRANLAKLVALIGDPATLTTIVTLDRPTVQLLARCTAFPALNFPVGSRSNSLYERQAAIQMTFRAPNPYWQDITPQVIGFTTSDGAMPQGTAPSWPVLTTDTAAAGADTLTGKDYLGNTLWTATLAARTSGQRYRITTQPSLMTVELYTGGVWTNSDASLTGGTFPPPLPSSGTGYQSGTWPTLCATTGNWTATYSKQWR